MVMGTKASWLYKKNYLACMFQERITTAKFCTIMSMRIMNGRMGIRIPVHVLMCTWNGNQDK